MHLATYVDIYHLSFADIYCILLLAKEILGAISQFGKPY